MSAFEYPSHYNNADQNPSESLQPNLILETAQWPPRIFTSCSFGFNSNRTLTEITATEIINDGIYTMDGNFDIVGTCWDQMLTARLEMHKAAVHLSWQRKLAG